jgi:hypothetical protein
LEHRPKVEKTGQIDTYEDIVQDGRLDEVLRPSILPSMLRYDLLDLFRGENQMFHSMLVRGCAGVVALLLVVHSFATSQSGCVFDPSFTSVSDEVASRLKGGISNPCNVGDLGTAPQCCTANNEDHPDAGGNGTSSWSSSYCGSGALSCTYSWPTGCN